MFEANRLEAAREYGGRAKKLMLANLLAIAIQLIFLLEVSPLPYLPSPDLP